MRSWPAQVLALELKKALAYRFDFWIQFLFHTATDILVSYALWKAVFVANQAEMVRGFSLTGMIYYYILAAYSLRVSRGAERGYISQEIYNGGLTRYLLYPLSFMGYKFVTHFANQLLTIVQFALALLIVFALFGLPAEQPISGASLVAGLTTALLAGYLHFVVASCLELVAFWQDVVWNLMVMLRFVIAFLGGSMLPLSFFPEWGQRLVAYTPFPLLVDFATQTSLGHLTFVDWCARFGILCAWSLAFTLVVRVVWRRGLRQYSGVGI